MERFYWEEDGVVSMEKENFERLVYQLKHLFKQVDAEKSYAARDLLREIEASK